MIMDVNAIAYMVIFLTSLVLISQSNLLKMALFLLYFFHTSQSLMIK